MNQRKNRQVMLAGAVTLVGATGVLVGCSGAADSGAGEKAGTIVVDGKTFEPLPEGSASSARATSVDSYGSDEDKSSADAGAHGRRLADESEAELAEDLRPILGRDGKLYQSTEPATDLARAFKRGESLGKQIAGGSPAKQLYAPIEDPLHTDFLFNPGNPGHPQSTDFRTADNINTWPSRTVVFLAATAPDGARSNCTGTYVGAHTLLTAAHCVRLNGHSFGMNIVFTPAAQGSNGVPSTMPFGQYNGCYDWWYPSAWDSSGQDEAYDFAVIDFRRCGNPTIGRTGWMGIQSNPGSFPNEREDGYPGPYNIGSDGVANAAPLGTGTPGCGRTVNPSGAYPFLCGSSGPARPNDYRLESDTLNSTPGDSGGPWWQWYNNNTDPRVDAVNSGYRSYFDFTRCGFDTCYRNFGHLVDTSYWNFIVAHSEIGH